MIKAAFSIDGKKDFTPSKFFITNDGTVYVFNYEIGFIRNDTMTEEKLKDHIYNMVMEGFTIENIPLDKMEMDLYRKAIVDYDIKFPKQ